MMQLLNVINQCEVSLVSFGEFPRKDFPIKTPTAMHSIKAEFLIAKRPVLATP